jgi:predicted dehydrogenase
MTMKKRYALVGVGSRGMGMFAQPLGRDFADVAELVALCDHTPRRLALAVEQLTPLLAPGSAPLAVYTDYAAMLAEVCPEVVIVCTVDATHHQFIIPALEAGCAVITEKPLTTTAENARAILAAERRSGLPVRVSFNARYGAAEEALYQALRAGVIGDILSADYAEFLDTYHGADYFRRWHRQKANSGGLLVHKATHHFDQLNWWIGAAPVAVHAFGQRRFYVPERHPAGLADQQPHGERCLTCAYTATCPFFLDLRAEENLRALYLEAEGEDGYIRDGCVFSASTDIEDSMAVAIRYENGVLVNYALNAFAPYEGQRIGFNGTQGRLEVDLINRYHGLDAQGRLSEYAMGEPPVLRVSPLFGRPYTLPVEQRHGTHAGADERIRIHLFRPEVPDPLAQKADARAGAMAALIGIAANQSIATGQQVRIADLLSEG